MVSAGGFRVPALAAGHQAGVSWPALVHGRRRTLQEGGARLEGPASVRAPRLPDGADCGATSWGSSGRAATCRCHCPSRAEGCSCSCRGRASARSWWPASVPLVDRAGRVRYALDQVPECSAPRAAAHRPVASQGPRERVPVLDRAHRSSNLPVVLGTASSMYCPHFGQNGMIGDVSLVRSTTVPQSERRGAPVALLSRRATSNACVVVLLSCRHSIPPAGRRGLLA